MANEKRLIDADALCEFFQERYEYLRNASERQLPSGYVQVDTEIQCGAIIAKEFLDKVKGATTVDAVEVVHAYWTGSRFKPMTGEYEEYCSNCCEWSSEYGKPYCPNCGAKMDGGNEDV